LYSWLVVATRHRAAAPTAARAGGDDVVTNEDDRSNEALVVMRSSADGALDAVRERFDVRHVFSSRAAVVVADAVDEAALRHRDDVALVTRGMVPDDVLASLDDSERLLVRGWAMRSELQRKQRPGDRASWDSEGRLPPDLPPDLPPAP
jgi:hypothetical protein